MEQTTQRNSGMLTGLFNDRQSAERAYQGLSDRGYSKDDINIVMSDEARRRHFSGSGATTELGNKAAEGAGVGGAVGGTVGAALAAIAATGTSLAVPGLGLVIAGPLAAAAAGAGAGAATGGLLGALIGWGIPEERIKHYESGLKQGGILMGVTPRSEADAAFLAQHWRGSNGQHIYGPGGISEDTASSGMASMSGHTVIGVYDNRPDADKAAQALADAGISRSNIHLNAEPASSDSAGPIASTADRDSGSGIGGFFRNLFGMDDAGDQRDMYAESVRRGSHVLTVDVLDEEQADRVSDIMARFDPVDIDERSNQWKQQGWTGYNPDAPRLSDAEIAQERGSYAQGRTASAGENTRIPVVEEQLKVGKREVQRGGIRVVRRLRETPVHESIQLREEHVNVERRPVDKPATEADFGAFKEGSVELREMAEEPVVSKTARVVEEVVVGKEVSQRTENIDDTVRRTDVEVERLGASADDDDFRRHWQTSYGAAGGRYEDYDAAYRYGSNVSANERYRNYQWSEVEPQLRSDWESNHPESAWEKVKDAVRYGAERVTGGRHH